MHVVLGVGMRAVFGWRFGVVATIFAAKELGELKYRLPGSALVPAKHLAMYWELFFNPAILVQWLLPALAAWAIGVWLSRKNNRSD